MKLSLIVKPNITLCVLPVKCMNNCRLQSLLIVTNKACLYSHCAALLQYLHGTSDYTFKQYKRSEVCIFLTVTDIIPHWHAVSHALMCKSRFKDALSFHAAV